jgi:hypothetical protein
VRTLCSVEGCGRRIFRRGLCSSHYERLRKTGDVQADKPLREFQASDMCAVEGCSVAPVAKGLCGRHYSQARSDAPKVDPGPSKACTACGQVKPVSDFIRRPDSVDGYRAHCKQCQKMNAPRCTFPGCPNPHKRGGLCDAHSKQRDRGSDLSDLGTRQGGLNRGEESAARAEMIAAGFLPSVSFKSIHTPWVGVCLHCGQPGAPALSNVRHLQTSPCAYCVGNSIDDAVRVGKMLAAGFEPLEPCPGSVKRWKVRHLECGELVEVTWMQVMDARGDSGCPICSRLGFRVVEPAVFYAVTDGLIVKGGVSNSSAVRLRQHAKQGLEDVLAVVAFATGAEALVVEREWIAFVRGMPDEFRVDRDRLPDGFTEAVRVTPSALRFLSGLVGQSVEMPSAD